MLLVLEVPDAVVVVLVLPLEARLAPTAVDVVLVALGVHVNRERLSGELLGAVRAGHDSLLAVEEVLS